MRRLALVIALLLVPLAAQAFDPENPARPETIRIGILKNVELAPDRYGTPLRSVPAHLRDELRRAGFDAFTLDSSIDELASREDRDADFYIEIDASDRYEDLYGGIDVYGRNAGTTISVGKRTIEARVRMYDGATLDLVAEFDVDKTDRRIGPTSIGIGGRTGSIWTGINLSLGLFQHRSAARGVAKLAAVKVAEAVRTP